MTTPLSVLGVSGMCWVVVGYSTQCKPLCFADWRALCRVCWVYVRVRAYVTFFDGKNGGRNSFHAMGENPNTPNTLNSNWIKTLVLKGLFCVGYVSGIGIFVWGSIGGEMGQ